MPPKKKLAAAKPAMAKASGDVGAAGKKKKAAVKRDTSLRSIVSSSCADDVPDDLACGICRDVLDGARQTPCCGGLSCRACIEAVAAGSSKCPYCRAALSPGNVLADVRAERAAACFVRPCKYDGCDYRGKRDVLKAHEIACRHRPAQEVIAELRDTVDQWRRQRCFQISHIRSRVVTEKYWSLDSELHLELLYCRVHVFNPLQAAPAPRVHDSVKHPPCAPQLKLMPRTRAEVHCFSVGYAPVIKLSHIEDQDKPTTCYIINSYKPGSARRVTIPAKASEALVVKDLLTEERGRGVVNVHLAKTLGDFGLGPDGNYADPNIAQVY